MTSRAGRVARWTLRGIAAAAVVAYPILVYVGLMTWSPRVASLALLGLLLPAAAVRLWRADREALKGLAIVPLIIIVVLALGAIADAAGWVLAVPVVINGALLIAFSTTLRAASAPMIERFARLQVTDLSEAEQRWCRQWTIVWCGFFALNAAVAAALALWAPLPWWAVYNGLIAYVLMGVLFAAEYVPRKLKFGRWGRGPLDRLLLRILPRKWRAPQ